MKGTYLVLGFFAAVITLIVTLHFAYPSIAGLSRQSYSAAIFFVESISTEALKFMYTNSQNTAVTPKVRILIVPGHEPDYGGTEYGGYTERDLVADLAQDLQRLLSRNPKFEVIVARDKFNWRPDLAQYFVNNEATIKAFRQQQMSLMEQYIREGKIVPEDADSQVDHNYAPEITALHLYGIHKWASENNVYITLHLHLNDFPARKADDFTYTGFAIYVPNSQYSNARASRALAESLAGRLNAYHATSSLPKESSGVIEDQELIAVGSNNSSDAASILIEYGYIFERQFRDPSTRALALNDYAYETYLGLQDFFNDRIPSRFGTNVLPYEWTPGGSKGDTTPNIYAMQAALHFMNLYPPPGHTFNDCPISGYFGGCTMEAFNQFELSQGLGLGATFDDASGKALQSSLSRYLSFR